MYLLVKFSLLDKWLYSIDNFLKVINIIYARDNTTIEIKNELHFFMKLLVQIQYRKFEIVKDCV